MQGFPTGTPAPGGAGVKYAGSRNYLGLLFAGLAVLSACDAKHAQTAIGQTQANSVLMLRRELAHVAGQANQAAPAAVDPDTRMDGATAGPGLKLTIRYTLVNAAANGIDATTFGTKLVPVVRKASCTNPDLRPLIDQGAVVALEYRGLDGALLGTTNIDRGACAASNDLSEKTQ